VHDSIGDEIEVETDQRGNDEAHAEVGLLSYNASCQKKKKKNSMKVTAIKMPMASGNLGGTCMQPWQLRVSLQNGLVQKGESETEITRGLQDE
jgi:hypothetical protein